MRDIQLEDGTWATTPIHPGGNALGLCDPSPCTWEDFGPPTPFGLLGKNVQVQLQRCARCRWVRGRYLSNPYPEKISSHLNNQDQNS